MLRKTLRRAIPRVTQRGSCRETASAPLPASTAHQTVLATVLLLKHSWARRDPPSIPTTPTQPLSCCLPSRYPRAILAPGSTLQSPEVEADCTFLLLVLNPLPQLLDLPTSIPGTSSSASPLFCLISFTFIFLIFNSHNLLSTVLFTCISSLTPPLH